MGKIVAIYCGHCKYQTHHTYNREKELYVCKVCRKENKSRSAKEKVKEMRKRTRARH